MRPLRRDVDPPAADDEVVVRVAQLGEVLDELEPAGAAALLRPPTRREPLRAELLADDRCSAVTEVLLRVEGGRVHRIEIPDAAWRRAGSEPLPVGPGPPIELRIEVVRDDHERRRHVVRGVELHADRAAQDPDETTLDGDVEATRRI